MINKIYNFLFSKNVIRVAFLVLLVPFIISLYHRYIQQDEPWFGEQAYWLLNEGNVKLKSMPGIFNWTDHMLIYHKLFIWAGAALIYLGWSVYILKTYTLVLYLTCGYLLYNFAKRNYPNGTGLPWVTLFLFLITPELIHRSFIFRPEIMVMTLGFSSFLFLYHLKDKNYLKNSIGAGLFAGLAFLTHLNALVFPVAGFFYLLYFKRWRPLVIFTIACAAIGSLYTIGLWSFDNLHMYRYQIQHWPTHQDTFGEKIDGGIFGIIGNNLLRLINEHKRYFWDEDVWGVSAMFLIALIARFKYLKKEHSRLLVYSLILMLSIGLFSSSHGPRYLVYLLPFMILTIAFCLYNIKMGHYIFKSLIIICISAQMIFAGVALYKIYGLNYDHTKVHAEVLHHVNVGSKILAPWEFIYDEIDQYKIHSFKTYEYIEDQKQLKLSQEEFLSLAANRFGMDYIILDKKRKEDKEFPWFKDWKIVNNPYYRSLWKDENYLILAKKN